MSPAKKKRDYGLIAAIVFAAVIVSGSIIFFATQVSGGKMSDEDFAAMVEKYSMAQQAEALAKQQQSFEESVKDTASEAKKVAAISDQDHIYGNKDAKISLIEYSDFQCPYCTRFHDTAKQIVDQYDGNVNWVYRHFPLSFHEPAATKQAIASECVAELGGNDSFWEFGELMFANGYESEDQLAELAVQVGVSESDFADCLASGRYDNKVKNAMADATNVGVTGTPGNILLNNETGEAYRIDGAQPLEVFSSFIDQMM